MAEQGWESCGEFELVGGFTLGQEFPASPGPG